MANKLYLEENYVVWEVDGTPTGEYSKNHCVYRETTTSFIIKEEIDNGQLTILKTDVDGGNWLDGSDVAYTTAGLRTWLRANSGFKTASGGSEAEFIMLVKTDNAGISASNQFIIPTTGVGYNYDVDWGDGNFSANVTGSVQHTYASAGNYVVKISGAFPRIYFNNGGDRLKLLEVQNWGNIAWSSMFSAFYGCSNMDVTATDVPDLSSVTSIGYMFRNAFTLVGNSSFQNWDTSNVTDMSYIFFFAVSFNQNIGSWNVSNVTNMSIMFHSSGMSTANYTDTIVGWANFTTTNLAPYNVNMSNQSGRTFDTSRSGGLNFATAGDARTYLTTATPTGAGWTISSDTVI